MENAAKQAIDEGIMQVKLFLDLDPTTSQYLVDEIVEETNLNVKLSKFLHLVIDRLKFQDKPQAEHFKGLITSLSRIDSSTPHTKGDFLKWLPQRMSELIGESRNNIDTMKEWRSRFKVCQRKVTSLEEEVSKYHHENETLRNELKLAKAQHKEAEEACTEQQNNHNNKVTEMKRQIRELTQKIKTFPDIEQVRSHNAQLLRESAEAHEANNRKISNLRAENEALKQEIEKLSQRNQKLKSSNTSQKEKMAEMIQYIESIESEKTKLEYSKTRKEREYNSLTATLSELKRKNGELGRNIQEMHDEAQRESTAAAREKSDLLKQIELMKENKNSLSMQIHKKDLDAASKDAELAAMRAKLKDAHDTCETQRSMIHELEIRIATQDVEIQSLKRRMAELSDRKAIIEATVKEKQTEVVEEKPSKKVLECGGCSFDVDGLEKKMESLEKYVENLRSQMVGCTEPSGN